MPSGTPFLLVSFCGLLVSSMFLLNGGIHHAAADGEGGDEKLGDEEQGGDNGKQQPKKKSGSDKKSADKDSERGMLKSPGNRQQMRSRAHTPSDGYRQDGFMDESAMDGHQAYPLADGDLTRFPSINMDWQTLRVPR